MAEHKVRNHYKFMGHILELEEISIVSGRKRCKLSCRSGCCTQPFGIDIECHIGDLDDMELVKEVDNQQPSIGKSKEWLEKCKSGKHPLTYILNSGNDGFDAYSVARWCPICGAIVVDTDYDGRVHPGGQMKMKLPRITQEEAS